VGQENLQTNYLRQSSLSVVAAVTEVYVVAITKLLGKERSYRESNSLKACISIVLQLSPRKPQQLTFHWSGVRMVRAENSHRYGPTDLMIGAPRGDEPLRVN
jgi:hypothetical protein